MRHANTSIRLLSTAILTLAAMSAAQAASFSGPITVSLIAPGGYTDGTSGDPTPLNLTQVLTPPSGTITASTGGEIGSFMLSAEQLALSGTSLHLTLAEGDSNGTTGYLGVGSNHARYVFTGLNIAGQNITGLTYTMFDNFAGSGVVGVDNLNSYTSGSGIKLLSSSSVEVDLDTLHFTDRHLGESLNHVDIAISFTTTPAVPEPSSMALSMLGLGVLALVRRTSNRRT